MQTELIEIYSEADKEGIARVAEIINQGGIVAIPTETVYGLAASAYDDNAIKAIFNAKGRPQDNPLIVHIAKKEQIIPLVEQLTPKAELLIEAFFPGPLTIILKKSSKNALKHQIKRNLILQRPETTN